MKNTKLYLFLCVLSFICINLDATEFMTTINSKEFNDILTKKVDKKIEWEDEILKIDGKYWNVFDKSVSYDIELQVTWVEFISIFKKYPGYINTVIQSHSCEVTIYLSNGTRVESVEPKIDDFGVLVENCGNRLISIGSQ